MFRKLYERILALSHSRWAIPTLAGVAFAESSFFPIPPDLLLVPMVLARRERAWLYATICTVASVTGGLLGYAIGYFLQPLGFSILKLFGHSEGLAVYQHWFADNGVWVILIKGLTPIPYKLVTIACGLARFSLPLFLGASVATRGARFFVETALLRHPAAKGFVDKHLVAVIVGALLLAAIAIVAVKFIH